MTPNTPAGGAVAWAVRDHSDGQLWVFVATQEAAEKIAENVDDVVVPLYTQPPATVPAEAVMALVAAIEADAADRAIKAEMGASEWRAFVPHRIAAALDELEALTRGEGKS